MDEQHLQGGITNVGRVGRDGAHLLRPSTPTTESVHALLRSVRRAGFEGAPLPIGIDNDGRERLEFVPGDVPLPPYPNWAQSDAALASVAKLLRAFHDASQDFEWTNHAWPATLADPCGGAVVCHNDVELSNVVFRSGIAVALIDFEFAAPGRPEYDLAQLARLCVPIDHEVDQQRLGWQPADRASRLRVIADAYGLDRTGRSRLLNCIDDAIDQIERAARGSIADGDPTALDTVNRTGGLEKYDRRRSWWAEHQWQYTAALL